MATAYQSSTKLIPDRAMEYFEKAAAVQEDLKAIQHRDDFVATLKTLVFTKEQEALYHIKAYLKEQ